MTYKPGKTGLSRRRFAGLILGGALAAPFVSSLRASEQVVVIGGGPAGASAALALRDARPRASILLVERDPGRFRQTMQGFAPPPAGPDFTALRRAGVEIVLDDVTGIDWRSARLDLFSGRALAYDELLLAPGTAPLAENIPGLDARTRHLWPAAWGSLREARRLRAGLEALPERGHVVLRLPRDLSHPQAALGRALDLAAYLEQRRPLARLTVLEGGDAPGPAEAFRARSAINRLNAVWLKASEGGAVLGVDADRGELETSVGRLSADLVNFVPPYAAGEIARIAKLTDESGWCPCDGQGRSSLRKEAVVIGDARRDADRTTVEAGLSGRIAARI